MCVMAYQNTGTETINAKVRIDSKESINNSHYWPSVRENHWYEGIPLTTT